MEPTPGSGSTTLEVRWILPGHIPPEMLAWLASFDEIEEREDRYLVVPSPDLGVKIKGGIQLDLKVLRGSPGELTVPGGGRGRLEMWEKWTFPLGAGAVPPADATGWITLSKARHRRSFGIVDAGARERPVQEAELPGCTVELTEFGVGSAICWTLGIEAGGATDSLEPTLHATVAAVFGHATPPEVQLGLDDSTSYAAWLRRRHDVGYERASDL